MKPQLVISKKRWDREFASGTWNYLDSSPIERARHAVIGMYCQLLKPAGAILDVGCGEGTLFDFLKDTQKRTYVGIDISSEAITKAQKKRSGFFVVSDALEFRAKKKYDVIVFSEVLYYLDEAAVFEKYRNYLKKNGILIVSLYRTNRHHFDERVWKSAKKYFKTIDSLELTGTAKKMKVTWKIALMRKI
ncbi:MAG: class I SAM-dependent methyltransferase [Candidatus Uhrbacteria bacterium]|nr:class I SAM-dependent methyltransferase [Candidatus Uhrbacteria bacterium]